MVSYLLSLIESYDEFDSKRILSECILLSDILNDTRFLLIKEFYNYLKSIDERIRNEKIKILIEMDSNDPPLISPFIMRNEFGVFNVKVIEVSKKYLDFIKKPSEEILLFKNMPNL